MAPLTREQVARALRSTFEVPLKVAPRHTRRGRTSDSSDKTSSDVVKRELVPGLEITDTIPVDVEMDGIFSRRLPAESISRLPASADATSDSRAYKKRIIGSLQYALR